MKWLGFLVFVISLTVPTLAATPPPPPGMPDVVRAGSVLAELNDWRAILFGAMFMGSMAMFLLAIFMWGQGKQNLAHAKAVAELSAALHGVQTGLAAINVTLATIEAVRARELGR